LFALLRYNTREFNADSTSESDEIRLYFDRQVVLKMVIQTSVFSLECWCVVAMYIPSALILRKSLWLHLFGIF